MLSVLHQKTIFFFLFFSFLSFILSFFFSFFFFLSPLILPIIEELVWCFTRYWLLESLWSSYKGGQKKSPAAWPILFVLLYTMQIFFTSKGGKKVGNKFCLPHPMLHCPIPSQMCVCIFYIVYFYIYYSSLIIFKTFYYHLLITPLFHS